MHLILKQSAPGGPIVSISRSEIEKKAAWVGRWCEKCARTGAVPCADVPADVFGFSAHGDMHNTDNQKKKDETAEQSVGTAALEVCEACKRSRATHATKQRDNFREISSDVRRIIIHKTLDQFRRNKDQHHLHLTQFCSSRDRRAAREWLKESQSDEHIFMQLHDTGFAMDLESHDVKFSICKIEWESTEVTMSSSIADAAQHAERADDIDWILGWILGWNIASTFLSSRRSRALARAHATDAAANVLQADHHSTAQKTQITHDAMRLVCQHHHFDALNAIASHMATPYVCLSGQWVNQYVMQQAVQCDELILYLVSNSEPLHETLISRADATNACVIYRGTQREVAAGHERHRETPTIWWLVTGAGSLMGLGLDHQDMEVWDPVALVVGHHTLRPVFRVKYAEGGSKCQLVVCLDNTWRAEACDSVLLVFRIHEKRRSTVGGSIEHSHSTESEENVEVILRRPKHQQKKPEEVWNIEIIDRAQRSFDSLEIAISDISITSIDEMAHEIQGVKNLLLPALQDVRVGDEANFSFCSASFATKADDRGVQRVVHNPKDNDGSYHWRFMYSLFDPLGPTVCDYTEITISTAHFALRDRALFHEVPDERRKQYILEFLKEFDNGTEDILVFTSELNKANLHDVKTQCSADGLLLLPRVVKENSQEGASRAYVFKTTEVREKYFARIEAGYLGCFLSLAKRRPKFKSVRAQFVLRMRCAHMIEDISHHDVFDSSMEYSSDMPSIGWGSRFFVGLGDVMHRFELLRIEVHNLKVHEFDPDARVPWTTMPFIDDVIKRQNESGTTFGDFGNRDENAVYDAVHDGGIPLDKDEQEVLAVIDPGFVGDKHLASMTGALSRAFAKTHMKITIMAGADLPLSKKSLPASVVDQYQNTNRLLWSYEDCPLLSYVVDGQVAYGKGDKRRIEDNDHMHSASAIINRRALVNSDGYEQLTHVSAKDRDVTLYTVTLSSLHRTITHSMMASPRTMDNEMQLVSYGDHDHDGTAFFVNNFASIFQIISDFKKVAIHKQMLREDWIDGITMDQAKAFDANRDARTEASFGGLEDVEFGKVHKQRHTDRSKLRPIAGWAKMTYSSPDFELCNSLFCLKIVKKLRVELDYSDIKDIKDKKVSFTESRAVTMYETEADGEGPDGVKHDTSFGVYLCHHGLLPIKDFDFVIEILAGDPRADTLRYKGEFKTDKPVSFDGATPSQGLSAWGVRDTGATLNDFYGDENFDKSKHNEQLIAHAILLSFHSEVSLTG